MHNYLWRHVRVSSYDAQYNFPLTTQHQRNVVPCLLAENIRSQLIQGSLLHVLIHEPLKDKILTPLKAWMWRCSLSAHLGLCVVPVDLPSNPYRCRFSWFLVPGSPCHSTLHLLWSLLARFGFLARATFWDRSLNIKLRTEREKLLPCWSRCSLECSAITPRLHCPCLIDGIADLVPCWPIIVLAAASNSKAKGYGTFERLLLGDKRAATYIITIRFNLEQAWTCERFFLSMRPFGHDGDLLDRIKIILTFLDKWIREEWRHSRDSVFEVPKSAWSHSAHPGRLRGHHHATAEASIRRTTKVA